MIKTIILSALFMLPSLSINLSAQTLKSEATVNGIVKTSEGDILADESSQLCLVLYHGFPSKFRFFATFQPLYS